MFQQPNENNEELLDNLDFDTGNEIGQNFNRDIYNQQMRSSIGYPSQPAA
jgi:hypothetical protein